MIEMYRLETKYACGGLLVSNGKVIDAAPIFRWAVGKDIDRVRKWKKVLALISVDSLMESAKDADEPPNK
jgi:hypothetical protein